MSTLTLALVRPLRPLSTLPLPLPLPLRPSTRPFSLLSRPSPFPKAPTLTRTRTYAHARPYHHQQSPTRPLGRSSLDWSAIAKAGGVLGAAFLLSDTLFNRSSTPIPSFERQYLQSSFAHLGGGLAILAASSIVLHRTGATARIMRANPWLIAGLGLVSSIGSMTLASSLDPVRQGPAKYAAWATFNAAQALTLSPLLFLQPALLFRAALYTAGTMGSICWVGATAKTDQYLWLAAPLLGGLTLVTLAGIAPAVLPLGATSLALSQSVSLYGGLAVFGGFTLYDTQKIMARARMVQAGLIQPDPLRESISLELDFINLFVRIVQILSMQGGNRR